LPIMSNLYTLLTKKDWMLKKGHTGGADLARYVAINGWMKIWMK
jgi:hypothetical protein